MKISRLHLLLGFAAAWPVLLWAGGNEFITYSATAAPGYIRPADPAGGLRAETYVFSPGKFFGSGTRDRGLESAKFENIVRVLAPNLAKQNYFPTKDVAGANLVIIVHWGSTQVYEDPNKLETVANLGAATTAYQADYAANGGLADSGALNQAISNGEQDGFLRAKSEAENAMLLGYQGTLQKSKKDLLMSEEERSLRFDLADERYFIVLMAYDNALMQKDHKPRLLWVTRLSVRSAGNNFTEALPALSATGADIYGKQIDGLVRVRRSMKAGTVKLGDLEVIGEVARPARTDNPAK